MMLFTHPRTSTNPFIPKEQISALKLVPSSLMARRLANVLLAMLLVAFVAMFCLPWQQSAKGTGQVTAYVPQEREQTVMSPIKGIATVERVAEGIVEGSRVKRGDFIVELSPAAANMGEQLQSQTADLEEQLRAIDAEVQAYERNISQFEEARDFAVAAADELIQAAEAKVKTKEELIIGYETKKWQTEVNFERQQRLAEKGIKSQREMEQLRVEMKVAMAKLESAKRDVTAAQNELEAKQHERLEKMRTAQTKVDYAHAMKQNKLGTRAKVQKDIRDLEIKKSELDRLVITAPRDGTILRMPVFERGMAIKESTPLFTIVPDTEDLAVELWVAGNDVPLLRKKDHVRLQFEGWPAVQFAGWPSVAVGTFGGEVAAIDATDDKKGKFRIQVRPDGKGWPSHRFLRQGVRANGWVMLQRVPLGYELWRQLNGFPPVVADEAPAVGKSKETKSPKLPK